MTENVAARLAELPDLLAGHMLLTVSALAVGIAVSIPLGIAASRSPRLRGPALAAVGLIQTVPSMALLALMVPLLGGAIGFVPAFVALTLYSMLPVLRNTVTGILEIDPAMTEAARGVGMTDLQSLAHVELPLAAPFILAGVRTATVWVVGMATLSTPVGAPSLGNYIFFGLQTRNWVAVVFGCVAAALLAVVLDALIRLLEVSARRRSRLLGGVAMLGLAVMIGSGLWPLVAASRTPMATVSPRGPVAETTGHEDLPLAGRSLTVGSKGFTEQYILAELLAARLEAAGARVERRPNMGSTILYDALRSGTVDVSVDYTGTLWEMMMDRPEPIERTAMFIEVAASLLRDDGVLVLGRLGFENAYALAMDRGRAAALGVRSIADLSPTAGALTIAGDPEFFGRPEWARVREAYGLGAARTRGMDSTFMYGAARDGEVDVIAAYTTDGRLAAFDLVVLEDPDQAFPPYDAVLLLSPRAGADPSLVTVLQPLVNAISAGTMRTANMMVDVDGREVSDAASWLAGRVTRRSDQP
jgi:osmoprotectant transport system permease protein